MMIGITLEKALSDEVGNMANSIITQPHNSRCPMLDYSDPLAPFASVSSYGVQREQ